jgi:thiol-disulfide isomerase/thioredoxin
MTERRLPGKGSLRLLGLAILAGACAGLVAVYVGGGFSGNGAATASAACPASPGTVATIDGAAKGEVAAFRASPQPVDFSGLTFKAPDGSSTTLASFAGRTVLVNLWATWCVPCRTEMPALDRLEAELGGDRFTVAAINIDIGETGLERAKAFLDKTEVKNLALYSDPTTGVFKDLKSRGLALGLPITILVDGRGCGLGILQGPAEWDSEDGKALIRAAIATGSTG